MSRHGSEACPLSVKSLLSLLVQPKRYTRKRHEFIRYGFYIGAATGLELALFWLLVHPAGLTPLVANAIAYTFGVVVTYILSIRLIFSARSILGAPAVAIFGLSCLAGLGINEAVIYLSYYVLGLPPMLSKILAVLVTFFINFFLRKTTLFRS